MDLILQNIKKWKSYFNPKVAAETKTSFADSTITSSNQYALKYKSKNDKNTVKKASKRKVTYMDSYSPS